MNDLKVILSCLGMITLMLYVIWRSRPADEQEAKATVSPASKPMIRPRLRLVELGRIGYERKS